MFWKSIALELGIYVQISLKNKGILTSKDVVVAKRTGTCVDKATAHKSRRLVMISRLSPIVAHNPSRIFLGAGARTVALFQAGHLYINAVSWG